MRSAANEDTVIERFKAVAHPLRLRILGVVGKGEHNVGEIEQATGIGQPALSQQLGVLRKAGLVDTRKDAKLVFYRLAAAEMDALAAVLAALVPADTAARPSPGDRTAATPSPAPGVANFARLS